MAGDEEFEAMAQACIANHEAIMRDGSPEMQMASRMLLYALAEEIARRERDRADAKSWTEQAKLR